MSDSSLERTLSAIREGEEEIARWRDGKGSAPVDLEDLVRRLAEDPS